MMFASDLDRTLIYSKRAVQEFSGDISDLKQVEIKGNKALSFMTFQACELLWDIATRTLFVPITTRSNEQFNRLSLLGDIPHLYAVTANGAHLFYKGKLDKQWEETILRRLKKEVASVQELKYVLSSHHIVLEGKERIVDDLFFYYILSRPQDILDLEKIHPLITAIGWRFSQQGRRLYFVPTPVCKGEAIKYIKEREGIKTIIGAGDSRLDEDFLKLCDVGYVPRHGEIVANGLIHDGYQITKSYGVKAGEEILASVRNILPTSS